MLLLFFFFFFFFFCSEHLQVTYICIWCELLPDNSMTGIMLTRRKPRHTLVIGALRKKNSSLFLEYTFDMNNCYSFLLRKMKYNKIYQ